jgi:NAD+ diphosphatase
MLDRLAHRRTDQAWLGEQRANPNNRAMLLHEGACATVDETSLHLAAATDIPPDAEVTFLGEDGGVVFFAAHVADRSADLQWRGLRELGQIRGHVDLAITAIALDNWMRTHTHCSRCGAPTVAVDAGWSRQCPVDESRHFPRTDPAIIVLVIDVDDRALLGRQLRWQPGWFSTLAGFIEPGETAEAAVRREVLEECGIHLGPAPEDVRYLMSQPWPFPSSLMLGFHASAASVDITVDGEEIVEAQWFHRDELADACREGRVRLPPALSVARKLIEQWYGAELPGDWLR